MDKFDERMCRGLGLTNQQFDILQSVYRLQLDDLQASPKAVQQDFGRRRGKHLQKPNLFTILKVLRRRGFVLRQGHGDYVVDFDGVRRVLGAYERTLEGELEQFRSLSVKTESYFQKAVRSHERPFVEYLEPDEFSSSVSRELECAGAYYSTTSFPNLSFSLEVASAIRRPEYVRVLWDRCIVRRELAVHYLTDLNVEYLFDYVSKAYPDKEAAYGVCLDVVGQLEAHLKAHENLRVYYQDTPLYLDIHLPEQGAPREFYSHLRGLRSEILGVVHVKSRDAAEATKKLFLEMLDRGVLLRGPRAKRVLGAARSRLKEHCKSF